jgi:hypothetical protein
LDDSPESLEWYGFRDGLTEITSTLVAIVERIMQRTFLSAFSKIGVVVMLTSLAAYGQSPGGQSSSGQTSGASAPAVPASTGLASTAPTSTSPTLSGPTATGQTSSGQTPTGNSLGEIARQMREKQNSAAAAPAPAKVITNQDLGEGPEGRPDLRATPRPVSFDRGYGQQPGQQQAERWRSQILELKNRIANLQTRIDQINSSIHSGAQFEGAYSRDQALRLDRVSQLQMQLDEQKRKLEGMQDAARRAGLPSQTYDP